jgi:hypothetical protein
MQRPRMNGDADRNTLTVGQIGNVECEPKLASAVSSRQRTRDRSVRTMSSYDRGRAGFLTTWQNESVRASPLLYYLGFSSDVRLREAVARRLTDD